MIATSSRTSSGCTSGTGLAIAKTIDSGAIPRTPAADAAPAVAVGALSERGALGVEVRRAGVERPAAVAHDHFADALGEHDVRAGHAGRARADDHDRDVLDALCDDAQGVEQRGEYDDCGAVLVVVEDRDVDLRAQPPLDLEAARRRDVLKVDSAERRGDSLEYGVDVVCVLGVQAQRD